jgi:hypothetical protein
VVPVGLAEELLQALPLAVVEVGDRLGVLAGEVGEEALDVVPSIGLLRCRTEGVEEGLEEGFAAWQDATQQTGRDLGIVQRLVQPDTESSLHGFSFQQLRSAERNCTPMTCVRSG